MLSGALYFYVYFFLWGGGNRGYSLPFPPLFLNKATGITFPTDKGN